MVPPRAPSFVARALSTARSGESAVSPARAGRECTQLAVRLTLLVTPLLLGALAVPSGGLFRGAKFRDLHVYRQYGDALLAGHVPYRDFFVEYPPGAIPLFAGASFFPGGWYDAVFKTLMTLCAVGAIWCVVYVLARRGATPLELGAAALFLALLPIALGPVSLNTYDAFPAFLTAAAVAALVSGRPALALGLLGAATAAKLYAVFPALVALAWIGHTRGERAVWKASAVFAGTLAVLVVPWVGLSPGGVWDAVHAQTGRGLHAESLGASILLAADRLGLYHAHVVATTTGAVSRDVAGHGALDVARATAALQVLAALAPLAFVRRRPADPGLLLVASVAGLLAFAKVLSPQYLVWLIPLVPFAGAAACALLLAALVLAQTWFFHYHSLWAVGPQAWTLLARNLVLAALYALVLWKTSTPSSSKTSRQRGLLRSLTRSTAEGSGATRSA